MGEYDPLLPIGPADEEDDLAWVQELFAAAARPYLSFPWSWLAWALLLPFGALATEPALAAGGPSRLLMLWSGLVLAGGAVELVGIRRGRRRHGGSGLGGWALGVQGNLSLVGLLLSTLLVVVGEAWALPGLWLLLLGHSFYILGGLAFAPMRPYGILYQVAGMVALWPWGGRPFAVFAIATCLGNLWMAWAVWRAGRPE